MREIKFRGVSRETNKFVYGMLMYSCSDSGLVIVETVNAPPTMQDPCGDTINVYHGIRQGTESQCTGLKDRNGKEIYEEDVFKYYPYQSLPEIGKVLFRDGCFVYNICEDYDCLSELNEQIEIIGNIHENPELLK